MSSITSRKAASNAIAQQPEKDSNRLTHILVLTAGAVASLACFGFGTYFAIKAQGALLYLLPANLTETWAEIITFAMNTALTQCFESLAYIHSLSLRWTLFKEDRLHFNTNLRLFSRSKRHGPNAWYSNILSAFGLILGYAATSQLFVKGWYTGEIYLLSWLDSGNADENLRLHLNTVALLVLGLVILVHSAIGLWCLLADPQATKYWTSNALNTTLIAIQAGKATHESGRCMLAAREKEIAQSGNNTIPLHPLKSQPGMGEVRPAAMKIVYSLWALSLLSALWFIAMLLEKRNESNILHIPWKPRFSWTLMVRRDGPDGASILELTHGLQRDKADKQEYGTLTAGSAITLLFVVAVQGLQTLGLQCAELIIITARDEDSWRRLAKRDRGSRSVLKTSPYFVALLSWKNMVLITFKILLHWLLGQCLFTWFEFGHFYISIEYSRVFIYMLNTILFAVFITFLVLRRPSGPQPAAWGHIPSLANLVDDWDTDDHGRFWWGDKGAKGDVRHAGTSYKRCELQDIKMEAPYL